MTQDPEVDIPAYMASAGLSLVLGTNLFRGEVLAQGRGVPAEAVFVEVQSSQPPDPFLGSGDYWSAEVDVTVRGAAGAREAARLRARAILHALQRAAITGYVRVVAEDTEPEHLGADEAQCHEYALSITVEWSA
jgi:hypothetical protein